MTALPSVYPEQSEKLRKGQTPEKTSPETVCTSYFCYLTNYLHKHNLFLAPSPSTPLPSEAPACYNFPNALNLVNVHISFNPLNPELNPIRYLLALLGAQHFLHVRRIRVKLLTLRRLMSYIYGAPILDVSRSHTTTQHSQ